MRALLVRRPGPNWFLLGAGVGLLMAGALALRPNAGMTLATPGGGTIAMMPGLHEPPWRVLPFAAGWLLIGAGSRPGGSVVRGAAVALLLYVLASVLAWTAAPLGGVEVLFSSVLWWPRDVTGRVL